MLYIIIIRRRIGCTLQLYRVMYTGRAKGKETNQREKKKKKIVL